MEKRKPGSGGDCAISVMAKAPRPGHSKTRLCPPLHPQEAASLSAAFLRDTTENLRVAAETIAIARYAAYAPLGTEAGLAPHLAADTPLILADGSGAPAPGVEGFGRCLLDATMGPFARGHTSACVLSSDTPNLPTSYLVSAARLLAAGDSQRVVLGACDDGGYYLLGMNAPHAGLFADIAWSTETVAEATRARARSLGLDMIELPSWYDIDDAAALDRLLRDERGYAAPFTRRAIAALDLAALLQGERAA
ncbi:MAG TPA: DUF2064 domain-containing protein [Acidisoma sp.]|uniref:TIGR04282 family arsenosugar biosynthesis glycosyltransferase n=1 Tax=Acidisoma sp. TaxID=1872115 RepID=UPI002BB4C085|nr:DUF2064 domain-containing protein [Acidisoma sp.]HTI00545.1 DUF2064 domain-containing protein [Acidisoma sp.]